MSLVASNSETGKISPLGTPSIHFESGNRDENWRYRHTKEKCNWVENILQHQLKGQGIDTETTAYPCKKLIDGGNQRENRQNIRSG